jgi:hypothetical protein
LWLTGIGRLTFLEEGVETTTCIDRKRRFCAIRHLARA